MNSKIIICASIVLLFSVCFSKSILEETIAQLKNQNLKGKLTGKQRAQKLLQQMNLTQKVSLLHGVQGDYVGNVYGIPELGIPAQKNNDGPQGFRVQVGSQGTTTQFPGAMTIAASFDKNVAYDWGDQMAIEFYNKGANIQLGPGVCLARFPRNGRNFEYISGEDPYLGYHNVFQSISGIQSRGSVESQTQRKSGIVATAKHWVDNNQEVNRGSVSVIVSDRVEMEMYFQPFKGGIDAKSGSIMCSYNRINGTYSCQHEKTLLGETDSQIGLKNNLGFQGWVMSDWGATHNVSIMQGLDQEMPGSDYFGQTLIDMVNNGSIPESAVDDSVTRILSTFYDLGIMDDNNTNSIYNNVTNEFRNEKAREFARNGTVLLKNQDNFLPLNVNKVKNIVIIGPQANIPITGGCGSGEVTPAYPISPAFALSQLAAANDNSFQARFYASATTEALQAAKSADATLVFIGNISCEGSDLDELPFGDVQNKLVDDFASVAKNVVVVGVTPGAALLPFADKVNSILIAFMPGVSYGYAIIDIIFGVSPSARLPVTFPNKENEMNWTEAQYPGIMNKQLGFQEVYYSEGFFFGYRWYDQNKVTPKFCFGHGLSYSQFTYSNLQVDLSHGQRKVSVDIQNSGSIAANEVAQLYLQFPQTVENYPIGYPPKMLKGFEKIFLQPGEKQTVTFNILDSDISIFNVVVPHDWYVVHGEFGVLVGASSCDIRLNTTTNFPQVQKVILEE